MMPAGWWDSLRLRATSPSAEKAQEALAESAELARGIIDGALDAFVQIDDSGTVLEWNAQAEIVFGWSRRDAVGKSLGNLILPPVRPGPSSQGPRALSAERGRTAPWPAASRCRRCGATAQNHGRVEHHRAAPRWNVICSTALSGI